MKRVIKNQSGFSLAEILVVITLLSILAGVVLFNLAGSDTGAKESALKSNVSGFRQALNLYKSDHGWYPCDSRDYNSLGDAARLRTQLTMYTDASGRPSATKTSTYRFGPYLKKFPVEPITNSVDIAIDTSSERILSSISSVVSRGNGTGGWFYEAKSGNVVANLGTTFPREYSGY
ncbi:MAG: type II secretion system protein [Candidatus Eisenbacteria bacterium]|uniref:Type II secretion system protein n=1 Tax=Eiseniibacteriota bacterium TaxID=2212470 RepID=A0A7Y2EBX1_UNCEI|nr:type II secretion system protein [Candidatus Eisenbacteria bacterium]